MQDLFKSTGGMNVFYDRFYAVDGICYCQVFLSMYRFYTQFVITAEAASEVMWSIASSQSKDACIKEKVN
jgi:hypothetical protein